MTLSARMNRFLARGPRLAHSGGAARGKRPVWRLLTGLAITGALLLQSWNWTQYGKGNEEAARAAASVATEHSRHLKQVRERFSQLVPGLRVVFMDYDRAELASGLTPDDLDGRKSLAQGFAEQASAETGLDLRQMGWGMAMQANGRDPSSSSIPLVPETPEEAKQLAGNPLLCTVAPSDPDLGTRQYMALLMGHVSAFYEGTDWQSIRPLVAGPRMRRFVDYHEGGHCAEAHFRRQSPRDMLADAVKSDTLKGAFERHKGEVFADVWASLMLAQEGDTGITGPIADMRQLSAARNGPLGAVYGEGWGQYGGAVYHTAPALRATQAVIDQMGVKALAALDGKQLYKLARRITDANSLSLEKFVILAALQKIKGESGLDATEAGMAATAAALEASSGQKLMEEFLAESQAAFHRLIDVKAGKADARFGGLLDDSRARIIAATEAGGGDRAALAAALVAEKNRLRTLIDSEAEVTPGLYKAIGWMRWVGLNADTLLGQEFPRPPTRNDDPGAFPPALPAGKPDTSPRPIALKRPRRGRLPDHGVVL